MWIFPWIKFSWHSCSMLDKLRWLNKFWQFLCERLSSFNLKRFYYSYAWSCSLYERRMSFCMGLISRNLCGFLLIFLTCFTSLRVFTSFSSINHLLHLYAWFLILFRLTYMRFSRSMHLLMCLSLETLLCIIKTS